MRIPQKPNLFHHHGLKLVPTNERPIIQVAQIDEVLIGSNAVRLQIKKGLGNEDYQVLWYINSPNKGYVEGKVVMSRGELKEAFLPPSPEKNLDMQWAKKFGAESGVQGSYIRNGPFLNIPMPGTGHDGDPNISVFVTDEIQSAVRKLLDG